MEKVEVLRKCNVFREVNDTQLQTIAKICTPKSFRAGEILCEQDTSEGNLYVIEEGAAAVMLETGRLSERQVQSASNFDMVGWSAIIEPYIYTATVKSLEKTMALAIDAKKLTGLCEADPRMGNKVYMGIARVVAERLRYAYAQLLGITD